MSSRTVFVFWDSNHDPRENAETYCRCVNEVPAAKAECVAACELIGHGGG